MFTCTCSINIHAEAKMQTNQKACWESDRAASCANPTIDLASDELTFVTSSKSIRNWTLGLTSLSLVSDVSNPEAAHCFQLPVHLIRT